MATVYFSYHPLDQEELGIAYLAAALRRAGHKAVFYPVDTSSPELYNDRTVFWAHSLISGSGERFLARNGRMIAGGPHCTASADKVCADYAVQGPGEKVIVEIVEGKHKPGIIRADLPENLDDIEFPDREFLYAGNPHLRDSPMKHLITQRSCTQNCAYCFNHQYHALYRDQKDRLFRRRSVDNVVAEALDLRKQYRLESVRFLDDDFLSDTGNWLDGFFDRWYAETGLPYVISARAIHIVGRLVDGLKESGCMMVSMALESADPVVRQDLLKRNDGTNDDFCEALSLLRERRIKVRLQNMIGLPTASPLADAKWTLEWNAHRAIQPGITESWCSLYQPYPGTALAAYCEKNGFCKDAADACASSFNGRSGLNIPHKEELWRLQKWWTWLARCPDPDFVQLLTEFPLTDEQAAWLVARRKKESANKLYGLKGMK